MKIKSLILPLCAAVAAFGFLAVLPAWAQESTRFTVTVENIVSDDTEYAVTPSPLAHGLWAVHKNKNPLFINKRPASEGLEVLAEDGNPAKAIAELTGKKGFFSGAFPKALLKPGERTSFDIFAYRGYWLTLAVMLVQSNDKFYAPRGIGIKLFSRNKPISGDVTKKMYLWDAGTEADEVPGMGKNQPLRQSGGNVGPADSNDKVRIVKAGKKDSGDGFAYPSVAAHIRVTIHAHDD